MNISQWFETNGITVFLEWAYKNGVSRCDCRLHRAEQYSSVTVLQSQIQYQCYSSFRTLNHSKLKAIQCSSIITSSYIIQ